MSANGGFSGEAFECLPRTMIITINAAIKHATMMTKTMMMMLTSVIEAINKLKSEFSFITSTRGFKKKLRYY